MSLANLSVAEISLDYLDERVDAAIGVLLARVAFLTEFSNSPVSFRSVFNQLGHMRLFPSTWSARFMTAPTSLVMSSVF